MLAHWQEWYYLIYLLPLGLAFVMLIVTALMGGGDGDGDADAPGLHADAGHASFDAGDVTADTPGFDAGDVGVDAGDGGFHADLHGGDAAHDGFSSNDHHEGGPHHSAGHHALAFLGIGRAPLTLLLEGFMLTWGVTGIYATTAFSHIFRSPALFVPASMAVAGVCGLLGMKLIGAFGSRYMRSVETYVMRGSDLVGEIGVVAYPVSETMGRVHVYDRHGTLHIESCRVMPGSEPIPRNEKVILVKHETNKDTYWVERSPV